nr:GTPase ObgE [Verrucomicrobiales bacterium]
VLDMAGSEGRDPSEDLATLRKEIKLYDDLLAKRPWIVVANKMDLPEAQARMLEFKSRFPRVKVIPISAEQGSGLDKLRDELRRRVGHSRTA